VPRTALEKDNDLNKRRVAKFLKQLATALADARAYAADAAADKAASGSRGSGSRAPLTRVESSSSAVLGIGLDERLGRAAVDVDGHPWEEGEQPFNADYLEVGRVVASRPTEHGLPPSFLVKWRALPYASAHHGATWGGWPRMQVLTTALRTSLVPHRYASATWEGCLALVNHQSAIAAFRARQRPPPPGEVVLALNGYRPPPSNFTPLAASPQYKNGHVLQPHQLDGLNWLLFSWCGMTLRAHDGARAPPPHCRAATSHRLPPLRLAAVRRCHIAVTSPPRCDLFTPRCDLFTPSRSLAPVHSSLAPLHNRYNHRSVILADEMGLGKTAQAIAMLDHIWRRESIRGPFLIVAPLSTLAHWQREIEEWTDLSVLNYWRPLITSDYL
jgi:hypothetical protein